MSNALQDTTFVNFHLCSFSDALNSAGQQSESPQNICSQYKADVFAWQLQPLSVDDHLVLNCPICGVSLMDYRVRVLEFIVSVFFLKNNQND